MLHALPKKKYRNDKYLTNNAHQMFNKVHNEPLWSWQTTPLPETLRGGGTKDHIVPASIRNLALSRGGYWLM